MAGVNSEVPDKTQTMNSNITAHERARLLIGATPLACIMTLLLAGSSAGLLLLFIFFAC